MTRMRRGTLMRRVALGSNFFLNISHIFVVLFVFNFYIFKERFMYQFKGV